MSVTIKDVARIAQVSHTTVSRALNDSPLINAETKERIKAIAAEHGYTPNFSAKSLVTDRSYNIGLFFTTLGSGTSPGFFYETVRGASATVKDRFNLVVRGVDDSNWRGLTRKMYDGILLMSQSAGDDAFLAHLLEQGVPVVVLNRHVDRMAVGNIVSDDRQGAYQVTEHLIRQGHNRIAVIEGKKGFKSSAERISGYLQALKQYGIERNADDRVAGDYSMESGYAAMLKLLDRPRGEFPTAVFASNDDMAVGAMKAIREAGLGIPEDISMAGFDDSGFSAYLSPALTTVKRPLERMSRQGAEMLLEAIGESKDVVDTHYVKTELIMRESIRGPIAAGT